MDAETPEIRQARYRASIKWLVSKAFNNRVPDNLKEPFYRDRENLERLKPQMIVEMGNASLYCQALSHLYSDPNYESLNHWSILQTLARKGVPVAELPDAPLTETVLRQTNPLKIDSHMLVTESLMLLYVKEVISGDRIINVIQRSGGSKYLTSALQTLDQLLLIWISHICAVLNKRIIKEVEAFATDEHEVRSQTPNIPPVRDFQDLSDGICLALLISYYCPLALPWTSVRINNSTSAADSLHNILLISDFSQTHLPYNVFHLIPEDISYTKRSMKLNLMVLLTDLFNLFEIHPAKCVSYPEMDHDFVVHKSRGITTLSSIQPEQHHEILFPARLRQSKEKSNMDTKDEKADYAPAGRPSNWEQNRRSSFAGRRSRKNSSSEDSQLTIENFGGSQEQLNTIGHFDRERERGREWNLSSAEPVVAARSSVVDARGSFQLGYETDSGSEKQDRETEKKLIQPAESTQKTNRLDIPHTQEEYSIENRLEEICPESSIYGDNGTSIRKTSQYGITASQLCKEETSFENASRLTNIRLKLEEKRRRIEDDKLKIESVLLRHKEKGDTTTDFQKVKTKDTKVVESADLGIYQQSIAVMNIHLQDLQQDIQKLVTQQNHIQAQHLQAQKLLQAQHIANMINQQQTYGSQQQLVDHTHQRQSFGSTPHLSKITNTANSANIYNSRTPSRDPYLNMPVSNRTQYIHEHSHYTQHPPTMQNVYYENAGPCSNFTYIPQYDVPTQQNIGKLDDYIPPRHVHDANATEPNQYYLSETSVQQPAPQRRTWTLSSYDQNQQPMVDVNAWQSVKKNAFPSDSYSFEMQPCLIPTTRQSYSLLQNNGCNDLFEVNFPSHQATLNSNCQQSMANARDNKSKNAMTTLSTGVHALDMMTPQSICFIGDEEDVDEIERDIIESMQDTYISDYTKKKFEYQNNSESTGNEPISHKLNITSGNLTYRIPSPTRPLLHPKSFQDPREEIANEKGFYISFDNNQPKRPKPPLRSKRSPKRPTNLGHDISLKDEERSQLSEYTNSYNNINVYDNIERKSATYNKHTDSPIQLCLLPDTENINIAINTLYDLRHHQQSPKPLLQTQPLNLEPAHQSGLYNNEPKSKALIIGTDVFNLDPESVDEMERRKEKIMLLSLQRRQQQEEAKAHKEILAAQKRDRERKKEEERARKKEEQMARRALILEQHRLKKAMEEAEREGKSFDRADSNVKQLSHNTSSLRVRQLKSTRPRPKTIHVDDSSMEISETSSVSSRCKRGSSTNLAASGQLSSNSINQDYYRGSQDSLNVKDTDSGFGRATPPRRAPSPGIAALAKNMSSPSGPGSLPPGLISKRGFDDGSSDISTSTTMEYAGPKLYKQPAAKSNRGIILNAVEYCVFPGAVNREAKQKVLERIARSEAKHFLVLFRDAGCQFRALYSYTPETSQVYKLYGTGPSQVDEIMFDKFFKYNSGGKCFLQVHTKHLTVTIDAFTIHNSLWQGKKVNLPSKKDMSLVI